GYREIQNADRTARSEKVIDCELLAGGAVSPSVFLHRTEKFSAPERDAINRKELFIQNGEVYRLQDF
ncbi:MAG: hypothetical protein PUC44_02100, partial [Eubacteriales bacterium]|nr:hypothetical protein [Eubacteriales bacterium]